MANQFEHTVIATVGAKEKTVTIQIHENKLFLQTMVL